MYVYVYMYIKPTNNEKCLCKFTQSPGFEYRLLLVQIQKLFIGRNTALTSLPLGIISLLI